MRYRRRIVLVLVVIALSFAGYRVWGYFKAPAAMPAEPMVEQPFVDTTDQNDLLPDLVPLPARDLRLERVDDRILLRFSTTYYNQGRGTAELRADPSTRGIRADIERDVLQRVYQADGGFYDKKVGTFLWHQEHLHYHFADFISYDLEAVDAPGHPDLSGNLVKSTYCLRDVSRVYVDIPNIPEEAGYKICGKELQGVSVGWGDTYYHDYPGQSLDISSLSSGTYKLTFVANPELALDEVRYDNNISSTLFKIDIQNLTIEILEEVPSTTPEIEHVHLDDPFGNITP